MTRLPQPSAQLSLKLSISWMLTASREDCLLKATFTAQASDDAHYRGCYGLHHTIVYSAQATPPYRGCCGLSTVQDDEHRHHAQSSPTRAERGQKGTRCCKLSTSTAKGALACTLKALVKTGTTRTALPLDTCA